MTPVDPLQLDELGRCYVAAALAELLRADAINQPEKNVANQGNVRKEVSPENSYAHNDQ